MSSRYIRTTAVTALLTFAQDAHAQDHSHHASAGKTGLHMEMTPVRAPTSADSARAAGVAAILRDALAPYRDTTAAAQAGYRLFLPNVKDQKVFHFTNNWRGAQEAIRFDPAKPTSLLYMKDSSGRFVLYGAMYTAPKRFSPAKLDARVPLSIARWHKHVNWCVPGRGNEQRWLERRDGQPVFGPESPIATEKECSAVGGTFHANVFGWMVHANIFAGSDLKSIWGDEHAGHDMEKGMKVEGAP